MFRWLNVVPHRRPGHRDLYHEMSMSERRVPASCRFLEKALLVDCCGSNRTTYCSPESKRIGID